MLNTAKLKEIISLRITEEADFSKEKSLTLDEEQQEKSLEDEQRKNKLDQYWQQMEKDNKNTIDQKGLLAMVEAVNEGISGSAGFKSKRETLKLFERACKAKFEMAGLEKLQVRT